MTITVIGATGRVGSAVVQRLITAGAAVRVLVRDPGKAQRLFGDSPNLETIRVRLDDTAAVAAGLTGSDAVFLAMGSVGPGYRRRRRPRADRTVHVGTAP